MRPNKDKVARRWLKKQAEISAPAKPPALPAGKMADLMAFVIAVDAWMERLEALGLKPTGPIDARALPLLRKSVPLLRDAVDQVFDPVVDRPEGAALKTPLAAARRGGPVDDVARRQSDFFRRFLTWARLHPTVLQGVFPDGRSIKTARQLAMVAGEDAPASRLNKIASVTPASSQTLIRDWVKDAAAEAGVPLSPVEGTLADAMAGKAAGETIRNLDAQLLAADPNTPGAARLQEEKLAVVGQLEKLAEGSNAPDVVLAAAAAAQTTSAYATETGKKLGHTPDQEVAMMARGKALIAAGAGSGKCIRGDLLVQTENGFIPIGEFCDGLDPEQDVPVQILIHGTEGPELTSHAYFDGFRQTVRVETTQGYEIEGTAAHKVLVLHEGDVVWKTLNEIEIGDVACIDRRPGLFAEKPFKREPVLFKAERNTNCHTAIPDELTPQVAALLGYIVSEGLVRKDQWTVSMATTDDAQADLYKTALEGIVSWREHSDNRNKNPQRVFDFYRHADIQALINFGLTREKAQDKEIPFGVLRSPKPIVTAFLRALFDGDGGVGSNAVEFCTASTKMARQLHVILLAYGIVARRKFRPNAGTGAWHFGISGLGLRRFHAEIGFNLKAKQTALTYLAERPENTNIEVVPSISGLCRIVRDKYREKNGTTKTEDPGYGTFKCLINGSRSPSFQTLHKFLDFYPVSCEEHDALRHLSKSGWFFDTIVEKENSEHHVYDFVVPETHSFSAGGFVNHNTRVLASKVSFHINEQGIDPSAIMATSFTTKASAELIARCQKYGAVIEGPALDGFGTTHAIAGKILNKRATAFRRPDYIGKKEMWQQTALIRLAMGQVQMPGPGLPAPAPRGLWEDEAPAAPGEPAAAPAAPKPVPGRDPAFDAAIDDAIGYFTWAARTWSAGPGDWAKKMLPFLKDMRTMGPERMSPNQKGLLNSLFAKVKQRGVPSIPYRVASVVVAEARPEGPKRRSFEDYAYAKKPAGMWFNLGRPLVREGKDGKAPIAMGEFKNAISILKGKGIAPSEAWAGKGPWDPGSNEAAVYGAYEWLKSRDGEPDFRGTGDMDDILIDVVTALKKDPKVRQSLQAQYKVILVDEAQDLNRCVAGNTTTTTPEGSKTVKDLIIGDNVLCYENGRVVFRKVVSKVKSSWEQGIKIKTVGGRELTMSPDHRIYATPLTQIPDGQLALYLMHRKDLGFRIGTTSRPWMRTENGSAGRISSERADCLWILEIGDNSDILYKEQALSLKFGIPTYIYEGSARGCDQERIDRLFREFGENGRALLTEYDLDFNLPHWINPTTSLSKYERRVVNFYAHRGRGKNGFQKGSFATLTYSGEDFPGDLPTYLVKGGRKMVSQMDADYGKARKTAFYIAEKTGARVAESLELDGIKLPLITASALFPGMKVLAETEDRPDLTSSDMLSMNEYRDLAAKTGISISDIGVQKHPIHERIREAQIRTGQENVLPPVNGSDLRLDEIESVEIVGDEGFYDIGVEGAENFFGNGILSHNCQHLLFGLLAGHLDPDTLAPWPDGRMTADTFALIGDDKQCVADDTPVTLASGKTKRAVDLVPGELVSVYRNGKRDVRPVNHVVKSGWTKGFRIVTDGGRTLAMSPNHKIWASQIELDEDAHLVYLMYRTGFGFRVGVTNKGRSEFNAYGARHHQERAERLWILAVCESRDEALFQETCHSLEWGIPTLVFCGEERGLDQNRIDAVFDKFGKNGFRLLEYRNLSFDLPHWMTASYSKFGKQKRTIQFIAHTPVGSQVTLEWAGDDLDEALAGIPRTEGYRGGSNRIRRQFTGYREALAFAEDLQRRSGANLRKRLSTSEEPLVEITASGLFPGMKVAVQDEDGVALETIVSVEPVEGIGFTDLDVDDASNFFGDGILSHNSIYEFRGADPDEFIEKSDMVGDEAKKGQFATKLLDINFRSGQAIVDAANKLIAHNSKQVPMVCRANVDRNGTGSIVSRRVASTEEAAVSVAEEVSDAMEKAAEGTVKWKDFGVACRSNAEAYQYGLELLKRSIPFKTNAQFFSDPNTKALIGWLTVAELGLDGDPELLEGALKDAVKAPLSKLGRGFVSAMEEKAKGSWARWLVDGGWQWVYGRGKWADTLKVFVDNVEKVAGLSGTPAAVLNEIFSLEGLDGTSMKEAMIQAVTENDDVMAELSAEAGGRVPEDMIADRAMAAVAPLAGLVQGRDDLGSAMSYVRKLQKVNEKLSSRDGAEEIDRDAVTIGTIHSWKGLEVRNMFVPMIGSKFPRSGPEGIAPDGPQLASERRLAYVAITRAEQRCVVLDIPHPKLETRSQFVSEACLPSEQPLPDKRQAPKEAAFVRLWDDRTVLQLIAETERMA